MSFHQRKRATLTDLFRTLLHQLMTAQIRVGVLDLEDLCSLKKETRNKPLLYQVAKLFAELIKAFFERPGNRSAA